MDLRKDRNIDKIQVDGLLIEEVTKYEEPMAPPLMVKRMWWKGD